MAKLPKPCNNHHDTFYVQLRNLLILIELRIDLLKLQGNKDLKICPLFTATKRKVAKKTIKIGKFESAKILCKHIFTKTEINLKFSSKNNR